MSPATYIMLFIWGLGLQITIATMIALLNPLTTYSQTYPFLNILEVKLKDKCISVLQQIFVMLVEHTLKSNVKKNRE